MTLFRLFDLPRKPLKSNPGGGGKGMRPAAYYFLAIGCLGLLALSYIGNVSSIIYYPFPGDLPSDPGRSGLWLLPGAIEVQGRVFNGFEVAFAPHSPYNESLSDEYDIFPNMQSIRNWGPLISLDPQDDEHGCHAPTHTQIMNKIALVKDGGHCFFPQKLNNFQNSGANAVITSGDLSLINLMASTSTLTFEIPGFIVNHADFDELLSLQGSIASLWTTVPEPQLSSFLEFLLMLLLRPLLSMFVVILIFHGNLERKKRSQRAKPETVDALPTHIFSTDSPGAFQQPSCSICLEQYDRECEICILPCQHEFHKSCVGEWLVTQRKVCPLCFHDITEPILHCTD